MVSSSFTRTKTTTGSATLQYQVNGKCHVPLLLCTPVVGTYSCTYWMPSCNYLAATLEESSQQVFRLHIYMTAVVPVQRQRCCPMNVLLKRAAGGGTRRRMYYSSIAATIGGKHPLAHSQAMRCRCVVPTLLGACCCCQVNLLSSCLYTDVCIISCDYVYTVEQTGISITTSSRQEKPDARQQHG